MVFRWFFKLFSILEALRWPRRSKTLQDAPRCAQDPVVHLEGDGARLHGTGRLADDGKRLCDPIAARNVVLMLAPQDNLLQY